MALGLWLSLVASILIAYVVFHFARKFSTLLFNGLFGLVVFWLLEYFGVLRVPLDFVTLIIAAVGGVLGVAIVVVFTALGVPL